MTSHDVDGFRLTVLNPKGRDPEQEFRELPAPGEAAHPPINFHAFAACTRGAFHRDVKNAIAEKTPLLLLLRGDFKASQRALLECKQQQRIVVVSLKETGLLREATGTARSPRPASRRTSPLSTFSASRTGSSPSTGSLSTGLVPISPSDCSLRRSKMSKSTSAIIGVGNIGGTVARHLVGGGEGVVVASRDAAGAQKLADELYGLAVGEL